jgi:hypothetical protein
MEVSGQLHPQGKSPYTPWIGGWVGFGPGVDVVAPAGNRTRVVQPVT